VTVITSLGIGILMALPIVALWAVLEWASRVDE
jgi:hypothetical protein